MNVCMRMNKCVFVGVKPNYKIIPEKIRARLQS